MRVSPVLNLTIISTTTHTEKRINQPKKNIKRPEVIVNGHSIKPLIILFIPLDGQG